MSFSEYICKKQATRRNFLKKVLGISLVHVGTFIDSFVVEELTKTLRHWFFATHL